MKRDPWLEPKVVTSEDECYFYHTMDIPNCGLVQGEWDLRGRESVYLGHVDFRGKRVLEIGTASGHLCFSMEKMGAEVVAYDLSDGCEWDIVPYRGFDHEEYLSNRKERIRRLHNGFWFAHRAFNSQAKVVYGTTYQIPDNIGQFDVCTFGCVLLHLRDPFLALQRATAHVRQTVIVTDVLPTLEGGMFLINPRWVNFLPNAERSSPPGTWWGLTPGVISEFLRVLGFMHTKMFLHRQLRSGVGEVNLYTVVGGREGVTLPNGESSDGVPKTAVADARFEADLEQSILESMPFSRIITHLLKRGRREVQKRLSNKA